MGASFVPIAQPLPAFGDPPVPTPDPEGTVPLPPIDPGIPFGTNPRLWPPFPFPNLCLINLRQGCYRITYRPNSSFYVHYGTMRVDNAGGTTTISGDLYRYLSFPWLVSAAAQGPVLASPDAPGSLNDPTSEAIGNRTLWPFPRLFNIPIYPRNRYYSYLRVTGISKSPIFSFGPCRVTLTAQEYVYAQPPAGQFDGTFPASPGSRTVTIVLEPKPAPFGFTSSYFEGTLYEAGVARGTFSMGWVSDYFRRATLEVDVLTGSVAPQAVGSEDFRSVFATAGWDLNVVYDQTGIPVPATVNAGACWSPANLHALMSSVRNPATNLDTEWHMHLIVVPATMGCGRGVMYDTIDVPREGVASFSDDGYPTNQSANFGTAANQMQRNVPRAFLRSGSHEVGHGFNQIHQEQEAGADNSIMTTTPSVADVLGGPTTGAPGVFPDQINLGFNEHVRHHLVHFPDITVRPGGMTFGSGHSSSVPEADRYYFSEEEIALRLSVADEHLHLGEPLELSWTLTNTSGDAIPVPTDIGVESQHAFITVTDRRGRSALMPSYVIQTDHVSIAPLDAGAKLDASTRVFWSSRGFAFVTPGRYSVEVRIVWAYQGVPFGLKATTDIWVNYPRSDAENEAASLLLHQDVGKYVALGGASHLTEAVSRLDRVEALQGEGDTDGPLALRGYRDLMASAGVGRKRPSSGSGSKPSRKPKSTGHAKR